MRGHLCQQRDLGESSSAHLQQVSGVRSILVGKPRISRGSWDRPPSARVLVPNAVKVKKGEEKEGTFLNPRSVHMAFFKFYYFFGSFGLMGF